jgi:hypothetical protein
MHNSEGQKHNYYKTTIVKKMWFLCNNRHIEQWKNNTRQEINLHKYNQLTFDTTKVNKMETSGFFYK